MRMQARATLSNNTLWAFVGFVLAVQALKDVRDQRTNLSGDADDVLAYLGVALLAHRGAAHGAERHGFLDLAVLGLMRPLVAARRPRTQPNSAR
jgi:hypothetical protein